MRIRITYDPKQVTKSIPGCIDIECQPHQSPMIPCGIGLIDAQDKLRSSKYIRVTHRHGLSLGQNQK